MQNDCINRLRIGMYTRLILSIILIYIIKKYYSNSKYILILLICKILFTDMIDSIFTLFYKGGINTCWNPCTGLHYYQSLDKILDLISYILIYLMLDCDPFLGLLILWRSVGVILFSTTKIRSWLVPFFDFIKEYFLYIYIFGKKNTIYMPIFIIGKIGFEYYMHIYRLSHSRCLNFKMNS